MPTKNELKGLIKIIEIPEGPGIPDEVRKAWVGIQLPCERLFQPNANRGGRYEAIVPRMVAAEALKAISTEAWEWWMDSGHITVDGYFGFGEDEVEVINDSVVYPQMICVSEEDRGNPDR